MSELRTVRFDDRTSFKATAFPFLLEREAEHNLILGLTAQLDDYIERGIEPYLAAVEQSGRVVAVALRTPPHQLVLSHLADPRALEALARDQLDVDRDLTGVLGAKDDAVAFAHLWRELTGRDARLAMEQRIYECTAVSVPDGVAGEMRPARIEERDLLVDWFAAFAREATPDEAAAREQLEVGIERRLAARGKDRGLVVWEHDGVPVSMAGYGGPTANGIRIGPVYTPPELRRRGYASACVAALTQMLLDGGRGFCFLYTDLSNPTSNAIYANVGYKPVIDVDRYGFI